MNCKINEQHVGSSLKLNCLISMTGEKAAFISNPINVNYLAMACLKLEYDIDNGSIRCFINAQTHKEAKDFLIKVKVQCYNGTYEWVCTDNGQYKPVTGTNGIYLQFLSNHNIFKGVHSVLLTLTISASKVLNGLPNKLYNDEEFTDFHLSSSEGSVPIHRSCLAARSNVFKNMLSQEWKETKEGRIQIEGVTLQTLQHLKRYMYLGKLPNDGLQSLLLVASYYLMEDLKNECALKLAGNVKPEELYSLFKFAFDNELPELTFAIISGTSQEVVEQAKKIYMKKNDKKENNEV